MSQEFSPLTLARAGSRATFLPYAAHVLSWQAGGRERLYLSERADYRQGKAIRGGVPIIFPQFAGLGPYPKHGFARTTTWRLAEQSDDSARLVLKAGADTAAWPFDFTALYDIRLLDTQLELTLTIQNTDSRPFAFTAALHTYLRVQDIAHARVSGLAGSSYRDSAAGGIERIDSADDVAFAGEVDRIYWRTPARLMLRESGHASLQLFQHGFGDTVLWNPGPALARALPDMPDDDYRSMVCVEAAAIEPPVQLQPGALFTGSQVLQLA